MADRHVADDHMLIDVNAHLFDGFRRAFVHLLIIEGIETVAEDLGDHVALFRFAVEQNIFCRREAGNQGKFLMHHADSGLERVKRRREGDLLAMNQHIAAVAAGFPDDVHAEQDFHQCTFTSAVFTDQTQHFALAKRKVDVRQNLIAEKVLLDISHLQQWSIVIYHSFSFSRIA